MFLLINNQWLNLEAMATAEEAGNLSVSTVLAYWLLSRDAVIGSGSN